MPGSKNERLEAIRKQLINFYNGANWVTDGMKRKLEEVDERLVYEVFPYFNHTLPQIVSHIIAWKEFVIHRLEGDTIFDIEQDSDSDWPPSKDWKKLKEEFESCHNRLMHALENFSPQSLDEMVAGRSYNFEYMLQGLVHHDYYHYGQAGLLAAALKRKADQDASPLV